MDDRYLRLRLLAESFWDCQEFRKAMASKARSETVEELTTQAAEHYAAVEKLFSGAMVKELRTCAPIEILAWREGAKGVGEHLLARLLGVIGDPYAARPQAWQEREGASGGRDDPRRVLVAGEPFIRNLGKLWAYCGVGDPARKRKTGMSSEDGAALGNPKAKTIMFLLAESCVKQPTSRYAQVYAGAREKFEGRIHVRACPQCKGSSAPGDPWRPGHQHQAALRQVAKEILRDLWAAARDSHGGYDGAMAALGHATANGNPVAA